MAKNRRRHFLESLTAAPLLPAALVQAQSWSPGPGTPAGLAGHLAEVVRVRYGDQLGPGDMDEVVRLIGESVEAGDKLKAVRLTNADEPVTLFSARRPQPCAPGVSAPQAAPPVGARRPGGRP